MRTDKATLHSTSRSDTLAAPALTTRPFPERRESYTLEHLRRLVLWESKRPLFSTSKAPHCSKLGHPNTCKTCTSCHFCRQKTMDIKTFCPCEHIDEVAGSMRGAWCRSCLEGRMGEDFEATMRRVVCTGARKCRVPDEVSGLARGQYMSR